MSRNIHLATSQGKHQSFRWNDTNRFGISTNQTSLTGRWGSGGVDISLKKSIGKLFSTSCFENETSHSERLEGSFEIPAGGSESIGRIYPMSGETSHSERPEGSFEIPAGESESIGSIYPIGGETSHSGRLVGSIKVVWAGERDSIGRLYPKGDKTSHSGRLVGRNIEFESKYPIGTHGDRPLYAIGISFNQHE